MTQENATKSTVFFIIDLIVIAAVVERRSQDEVRVH